MKKKFSKLTLHRETIKMLDSRALENVPQVFGGYTSWVVYATDTFTCTNGCCICA